MAKRTLIQILTAFLYNGNLPGFLNGRIWQGPSKSICVPGLNCYSCPGALGAFYSLFNKLSYFGIQVDNVKCIGCDACIRKCKMDCAKVGDRECINCGECIDTCPVNAISLGSKVKKADTNVAEATNN